MENPLTHPIRLLCGLAAALLVLSPTARADPVLTTHLSQATYDVDVRSGSELLAASGFSGIGITSYSTAQALSGDGVILQSFAGEFVVRTQQLKLHFQAHDGLVFDTVSFSHLMSFFNDRGGFRTLMSWTMDPEDGPAQSGSTTLLEDFNWFHGGSFSDATQPSPGLLVGDDAFDLDVTLFYASAGFSQGCFTVSGVCQQISANAVKVFVGTVDGPGDPTPVPEPGTLALLAVAGLYQAARRRSSPTTPRASRASGACPATEAQRA